jgi:hypothetical protein
MALKLLNQRRIVSGPEHWMTSLEFVISASAHQDRIHIEGPPVGKASNVSREELEMFSSAAFQK